MDLPNLFILRVNQNNPSFVLVTSTEIKLKDCATKIWKLDLCKHPQKILDGGIYKEDGIEIAGKDTIYQKESEFYQTKTWRSKRYLITDSGRVYEYGMISYCSVLSRQMYEKEYTFKYEDIRPKIIPVAPPVVQPIPIAPPVVQSKPTPQPLSIPKHMLTAFVELAILKKEECPITMEAFTKETVGCTPCGHLFDYESLKKSLESTKKCPTCRSCVRVEEIQRL